MAERQPKRRRELEDVEMTAVLAQPASERTCEVCGLLVHADIADNNYNEEGFMNENMIENVNAGSLAAISVLHAANPDGWQAELLEKGTIVYGHKSGQPLPEDAVREARGREIGLMADHGMYDIVARGAARGKLVRTKWLDDWGKNGMRSRLAAQQFNWAKRDDVAQNTPPRVVSLSAKRRRLDTRSVLGHDVWLVGNAVSLSTTHRLMRTLLSFRRKGCAPSPRSLLRCLQLRLHKWLLRQGVFTAKGSMWQ